MSKLKLDGTAPRCPVERTATPRAHLQPVPEISSPHPDVGAMGRVAIALAPITSKLASAASAPARAPGILDYVSELAGEDFLRFAPPEVKAFTLHAFKDARLGRWNKLRALAALLKVKNPFSKRAWKEAAAEAFEKLSCEIPRLTKEEVALIRGLISGPIADVVREREARGIAPPHDLAAFTALLDDPELRARLIALYREKHQGDAETDVDAALAVTRAILEQLSEHVDAAMLDERSLPALLDERGRLDRAKLDALPPPLRILLEDPRTGPQAIAALRSGTAISAHVLKKTPEHIIHGLTRFSASLAGGGFLWVNELVRTGRRLQITAGDVERARASIAKITAEVERAIDARAEKIAASRKIDPADKEKLTAVLALHDHAVRIEALQALAENLEGPAKAEAEKLAGLYTKLAELRDTDPKKSLDELGAHLDRFEDFRKDAVRIRVHGRGSARERGLEGAIAGSPRLREYAHRTLVEAVTYDYAHETSESARQIIYGVGGLAIAGAGIHDLLGDGAMHTLISIAEDVATDVGEIASLTAQGIPVGDVLKGSRFLGQLFTFGLATAAASQAHRLLAAGAGGNTAAGAAGGFVLGIGASVLSAYTSVYSYFLFKRIAKDLGREGKLDFEDVPRIAAGLDSAEQRAAFEAFRTEHRRIPTPAELVARIRARGRVEVSDAEAQELAVRYGAILEEHSHGELPAACRAGLAAVAARAEAACTGARPSLDALTRALEQAFDAVRKTHQGLPTGENLAKALASSLPALPKAALEAVARAQDELIALATSGVDFGAMLETLAASLAEKLNATLEARGIAIDRGALERRVLARMSALEANKEIDARAILGAIRGAAEDALAPAPAAEPLRAELESIASALEGEAASISKLIQEKLAPELEDFASRNGRAQTVANPVRRMLLFGAGVCMSSLTLVGAVLPGILLGRVGAGLLSFLASSESLFASVALGVQHRAHLRALRAIGEEEARLARGARETTAAQGGEAQLQAGTAPASSRA